MARQLGVAAGPLKVATPIVPSKSWPVALVKNRPGGGMAGTCLEGTGSPPAHFSTASVILNVRVFSIGMPAQATVSPSVCMAGTEASLGEVFMLLTVKA